MEQKTKVKAEAGRQEIWITRDFDLPRSLVFEAYTQAELLEQWMGNRVLSLESKSGGSYRFEKRDQSGNLLLASEGVIHEIIADQKIIRTFEMKNTPYPVQLEILDFHALSEETSSLNIQIICPSVRDRDEILKLPFAQGINGAHNRLQSIMNPQKI